MLRRAKTIARTEAHRIYEASSEDARQQAKAAGAKVVKQWDATLDGKTRDNHRQLDGTIVEVDGYFTIDGKKAKYPGGFGNAAEDCNCRCVALTRAKWALNQEELDTMQQRAAFFKLDKTEGLKDFTEKYLKAAAQEEEVNFWGINGGSPKLDYKISLTNRFEEGNETAREVYAKYVPSGGAVAGTASNGHAYTLNGKIYMDFDNDAANVRGAGTTFFHEHGHYIDYRTGNVSHSLSYLAALKKDLHVLYGSTGKANKRDAEYDIMRALTNPKIINKVNGISDIVYGLTKGRTGGVWHHDKKYYQGFALQEEAFAHMFEASFSTEKQSLMKHYFPTAWNMFVKLMEGLR